MSTDTVDSKSGTTYPPMSPQERAEHLKVPLSQRLKPDMSAAVPNRFVTLEEAKAYGDSWFWDGATGACRYGHNNAARRVSNDKICADCIRVAAGKEPIYGASRTQKYYDKPRRPAKGDPSGLAVAAPTAPAAAPAQIEPTRKELELLAAIAEHGDIDKACAAAGWARALMEARYSVNEVFRKGVDATLERLQIPRTLKSAADFPWTAEIERSLVRHFINSGLMHTAREAVGLSASEYFAHLESVPTFRAMVETARPRALETLKERSFFAASTGNDRLLKILTDGAEAPDAISTWSVDRCNAEIIKLCSRFEKQGLLPAADVNVDLVS